MTGSEKRSVLSLAFLYSTRMLGLFMVLPVFVLYGQALEGANELLIGLAIGAYGLSQAIFQIPFGALSDRFGRKRLIFIGLMLFFIGSVIAAASTSIYMVIFGRFLQGAGAIASVLMALLSDLTSEESRTKSMAIVGMSIGVSFSLALILGPLVGGVYGLQGIFALTAVLALVGIVWLYFLVPNPLQTVADRNTRLFKDQIKDVLTNRELVRLDVGIFALHLCLTALFIAIPMSLQQELNLPAEEHWWVYLTVMLTSFFAMVPFIIVGEKKQKMKPVFLFAIVLLMLSSFSFSWAQSQFLLFWLSLFLYFMAFNLLEASLPSLVSKICPAGNKGTAMGIYSTSQFFGAFIGGVLGGWCLSQYQVEGVYVLVSLVCAIWLLVARKMENPSAETGMTLSVEKVSSDALSELSGQLSQVPGVEEVVVVPEDGVAYLKVIKRDLDVKQLDIILAGYQGAK